MWIREYVSLITLPVYLIGLPFWFVVGALFLRFIRKATAEYFIIHMVYTLLWPIGMPLLGCLFVIGPLFNLIVNGLLKAWNFLAIPKDDKGQA